MPTNLNMPDSNKRPHEMIKGQEEEGEQVQKYKGSIMVERNQNIELVAEQALCLVKEVPTSCTERNKLHTKTGNKSNAVDQGE